MDWKRVLTHFNMSPFSAGILALSGGVLRDLNSSHISSIFTHSTPSWLLTYCMTLDAKPGQSDTFMTHKIIFSPFNHLQGVGVAGHIWMYCHRKAEAVISLVEVIEVVFPEILNNARVNPAVRIGHILDEHLDEFSNSTHHLDAQRMNSPWAEDRRGTSLRGSRPDLWSHHGPAASSMCLGVSCSRCWSTCLQHEANGARHRGARRNGHIPNLAVLSESDFIRDGGTTTYRTSTSSRHPLSRFPTRGLQSLLVAFRRTR